MIQPELNVKVTKSPCLFPMSKEPAFRCDVDCEDNLLCQKCGNILIDGYIAECFIGIQFSCFCCGEITETPNIEEGEILYPHMITLGVDGDYSISTANYSPNHSFTTDQQLEISNRTSVPKIEGHLPFDITEAHLEKLIQSYELVTDASFSDKLKQLKRHRTNGESGSIKLPFVWAMAKISERLKIGPLNLADPEINIALGRVYLFHETVETWRDHPRFLEIAKEFSNDNAFFHTVGMLVLAKYLFQVGNRVGLSVKNVKGESKPDLYFKVTPTEKCYMEVKSPELLTWELGKDIPREAVRSKIKNILKKSRSQINRNNLGMISILVNHPDLRIFEFAKDGVQAAFKNSGRSMRSLPGVYIIQGNPLVNFNKDEGIWMEGKVFPIANPHCNIEDNPFKIGVIENDTL